jgi:hypothetical protein
MSDLLPLLSAAALRDKVLTDAKDELEDLQKQVDASKEVKIVRVKKDHYPVKGEMHDNLVVYASGYFEDGEWGSEAFWIVPFTSKGTKACKVSDLENSVIYLGDGYPLSGFYPLEEVDVRDTEDDYATMDIYGNDGLTWIVLSVHGWPRSEWVPFAQEDDPIYNTSLYQIFGPRYHVDATVEFKKIYFWSPAIRGSLRKLLPPLPPKEGDMDQE